MNIVILVKFEILIYKQFLDNEYGDTRNVGKLIKWICRKHLVILQP